MAMLLALLLLAAPTGPASRERELRELTARVAESGRVLSIAASPEESVNPKPAIAPGAPPLLMFRYLEGNARRRFGNLDLVMDDAGH